jgi:hypothetical protein
VLPPALVDDDDELEEDTPLLPVGVASPFSGLVETDSKDLKVFLSQTKVGGTNTTPFSSLCCNMLCAAAVGIITLQHGNDAPRFFEQISDMSPKIKPGSPGNIRFFKEVCDPAPIPLTVIKHREYNGAVCEKLLKDANKVYLSHVRLILKENDDLSTTVIGELLYNMPS